MITPHELARLERSLRATKVLSVYLKGAATDPAERSAWRRRLDQALAREREALRSAPHDEREAFERCVRRLDETLAPYRESLPTPGWMGFFAASGGRRVESLPVEMPDLVAWETGPRIAPCVRVFEQQRRVIVAVADSRLARVYVHDRGATGKRQTLRSHAHVEPMYHMGYPPRAGFHTPTRGAAGSDAADRELRAGTEAMIADLVTELDTLAGSEGWIAVGGIPEVAAEVLRALPPSLRARARRIALDVHATDAEIDAAARLAATTASRERDLALVETLLAEEAAGGRGATRWTGTGEALREHAVERLFFTDAFAREHPSDAESLVRLAFEQDAEVEQVSGEAAQRLDAAGGVGARLRFVPARGQAPLDVPRSP